MAFTKIVPFQRRESGKHNVTYRSGTFRVNKLAAMEAGLPDFVEVGHDPDTNKGLLRPVPEGTKDAHRLSRIGGSNWGNTLSCQELADNMQLPRKGKTVYLYTEWDPEEKALIISPEATR